MVSLIMKDVWKSVFKEYGGLFVVIKAGQPLMAMLHANKSIWALQEKVSE